MEKIAYILLAIVVVSWLAAMIIGMVAAFPIGLIGLCGILAVGLLFVKVIRDRLANEEDDYYDDNIHR